MPLDFANTDSPAEARLSPKIWTERIATYAKMVRDKTRLAADLRNLEEAIKANRALILDAMGNAPMARCGSAVLTVKQSKATAATLTLADGRTVPWSAVVSVLVGNSTISSDHVAKLYGGRDGSTSLDVAGV